MARLIINADDYGFYSWVSQGILDAARAGAITATGVLANARDFSAAAAALAEHSGAVDAGVHLNATLGAPLSGAFPPRALRADGSLPTKGRLLRAILTGTLSTAAVKTEWRAQIERCLAAGLQPRFLNSHEHVHMLPALARVARQLAGEFGIPHLRHSAALPGPGGGLAGLARSAALCAMGVLGPAPPPAPVPKLLGLGASGRLHFITLQRILSGLHADRTYELMCHPGRAAPAGAAAPELLHYHDWPGELACLMDPGFLDLLRDNAVTLIRYRDLHLTT